jgi:hypothetical protein
MKARFVLACQPRARTTATANTTTTTAEATLTRMRGRFTSNQPNAPHQRPIVPLKR